jgi:predicted  nucleic acid-binding Zn-ribbon protein
MSLIDKLVQVAEIDGRRLALLRKIEAAPSSVRSDEVKVENVKAELARMKDDSKKGTLEVKRLEGELKAKQQEVEKTQTAQNQAKSNEEFQAHGKKMAALKTEIGDFEIKVLEEYERADHREKDRAPLEKKLKELEAEAKTTRDRVAAESKKLKDELAQVEGERRERLKVLDKDQLALYERALSKHGDRAVVAVVDNFCQGCLVSIRPNQMAHLKSREQVVTCWECGRLLYLE